mmetsp:Transcript_20704/g.26762  ORF Transcript_20704/g.26762 Transcript_20704/m.26762 type:complete len:203 (-) Transcript_20704:91-699(-)
MTKLIDQTIIDKELLKKASSIALTNPGLAASTICKDVERMKTSHFKLNSDHIRIIELLNLACDNFQTKMISDGKKRIEQALFIFDGIQSTTLHDPKLLRILDDAKLYVGMGKNEYAKAKLTTFLKYETSVSATFELSEALEILGNIFISEGNYQKAGKAFYRGVKVHVECCDKVIRKKSSDAALLRMQGGVDLCKRHCTGKA